MMRAQRRQRHQTACGQALVETALITFLLLTTVLGVYTTSVFASDNDQALAAVRAGARLGAEIGNNGWVTGVPTDPTAIDEQVTSTVLQLATQIPFVSTLYEVTIYQPGGNPDGTYAAGTDLAECYNASGPVTCHGTAPPGKYTLDYRTQLHPNEALIGVQIRYHYVSPTPVVAISTDVTQYTVMRLAPQFSG